MQRGGSLEFRRSWVVGCRWLMVWPAFNLTRSLSSRSVLKALHRVKAPRPEGQLANGIHDRSERNNNFVPFQAAPLLHSRVSILLLETCNGFLDNAVGCGWAKTAVAQPDLRICRMVS